MSPHMVHLLAVLAWLCAHSVRARAQEAHSWRRSSKFEERFLSVIFVGKTGTGKSTTANTLLDEERFPVSGAFESVTKHVQYGDVNFNGTVYRIYDTPGYLDVDITSMEVTTEIAEWIRSSTHGLDAFVFMFPYGRLGKEHWESFQTFKNAFGLDALNRTVIALSQLRPPSLTSEAAVRSVTACCKPGGQLRQACCEVVQLHKQGNPIIGIGDPDNKERRAADRIAMFEAIRTITKKFPTPYSNRFFDDIHANRTKLLQEINLLKYNHHRDAMRNMYEQYYSPDVVDQTIINNITSADLWIVLRQFQQEEKTTQDEETMKWAYRFVAAIIVSIVLEALVGPGPTEPLCWVERSYRSLLLFAVYCTLCITDLGSVGLHFIVNLLPPLWLFDVTSLMDLYFKLDDVVPLGAASLIHVVYLLVHAGLRYIFDFFEALYLSTIVATLIHEILIHDMFKPPAGEFPLERWSFIVMAASTLLFICQFDEDHTLDSNQVPAPIRRYRMAWRRPIISHFESVETDISLYEEAPEDEYPLRWRKVDTPWDLDSFRYERLERLTELERTIRLTHKDRGDTYTVDALAALPPVTICLPPHNTGSDLDFRVWRTLLAVINVFGAMALFLGFKEGMYVAAFDLLLLAKRLCAFVWYNILASDPEVDRTQYSKEWVIRQLELDKD
eukprot:GEMP01015812.1.p1 GENE.GEMP01015812.1~~GEMP01015812.1.p1  ORF type:complete len:671 (+),score=113.08 GEMP01015812.1:146-2158(+)